MRDVLELTTIQVQCLLATKSDPPDRLSPDTRRRIEEELRRIHAGPE